MLRRDQFQGFFTATITKMDVLWDLAANSLVQIDRRFNLGQFTPYYTAQNIPWGNHLHTVFKCVEQIFEKVIIGQIVKYFHVIL